MDKDDLREIIYTEREKILAIVTMTIRMKISGFTWEKEKAIGEINQIVKESFDKLYRQLLRQIPGNEE